MHPFNVSILQDIIKVIPQKRYIVDIYIYVVGTLPIMISIYMLWEPYPSHYNGLFSPLLVQRFCCQKGRSISVLSEQYKTSYLFYVTLSFLCNIICYLIFVFAFSLVTLSRATTIYNLYSISKPLGLIFLTDIIVRLLLAYYIYSFLLSMKILTKSTNIFIFYQFRYLQTY